MTKEKLLASIKFILLFVAILFVLSKLMSFNNNRDSIRLKGFYKEPENTLDVVTLGASEVFTAIAPGQLWNDYGFTSYDYAMGGLPITMMKPALCEVLAHQDPKLIIIELNGALPKEESYQTDPGKWRIFLDNIPWSQNKKDTLNEWVSDEDRSSYYLPFLKYHENWRVPVKCLTGTLNNLLLAKQGETFLKGVQTHTNTNETLLGEDTRSTPQPHDSTPMSAENLLDISQKKRTEDLCPTAENALRDLLTYLKDQKITNVLFIRIPHIYTKKGGGNLYRSNRAGEIVQEYGFPFLNLEYQREEIGLDWKNDFYNNGHMNVFGQKKFTNYLGRILVEQYGLNGLSHDSGTTERWNRAGEETKAFQKYAMEMTKQNKGMILYENWKFKKNRS